MHLRVTDLASRARSLSFVLCLMAASLLGSAACERPPARSLVVASGHDQSIGMLADLCPELLADVDLISGDPDLWRGIPFTALGTTELEPVELYRGVLLPADAYGRTHDESTAAANGLREGIAARCRAGSAKTPYRRSPVYRLFYRIAGVLDAQCRALPQGVQCAPLAFIHSDLRETEDAIIRAALKHPSTANLDALKDRSLTERFPPNTTVKVCGLAASKDGPEVRPETLEAVWREILPSGVVFEPTCATADLGRAP